MTDEKTEVIEHPPQIQQPAMPANPFQRSDMPDHVNAGAVTIESERAIAEAQGKLAIAKRFPRDQVAAFQRAIEACRRPGMANSGLYNFGRGGSNVQGPSIRLAEELARCWGNIDYGLRELSNRDGISEMEAYAWDLETNTQSTQRFTVRHIRDRKDGGQDLTTQRDIYEITANMGARRMRARILAILPSDLVDSAEAECKKTLLGGGGESLKERVRSMVDSFARLGVTIKHLESYLGVSLEAALPEHVADLRTIYASIKDGETPASQFFGATGPQVSDPNQAPDGPEQNAAEEKPKSTRRKRRSKEQIEADKAALNPGPPQNDTPDDAPPPIQEPEGEPLPDEPQQSETVSDELNKPLF